MIIMYSQGGNFKTRKSNILKHAFMVASLGNFGESRSICLHQYFNLNFNHTVSCNMGQISNLMYSGIIPDLGDDQYSVNDYCYDVKKHNNTKLDECTQRYFLQDNLENDFKSQCKGKSECSLNLNLYLRGL